MANIRSQIKRNRQNIVRRHRNKAVRSMLKTYARRFDQAVETGDRDLAEEAYRTAAKHFDKAASKGVIHRNTAANHKSKLARRLRVMA
ncbi:MAG TPA: 30S ribosomal protein S20 [Nitriliruptorales bacterium]|nr:30S ribosomal protein S20 [Nitriliruptorales bacterium]